MPIPIIAGNWKMNTTLQEAKSLVAEMKPALDSIEGVQTVVCPPFTSLAAVGEMLKGSSVGLGAQNLYYEAKGAYTGEISPAMVADICQLVVLGHSERRQHFGETDELINLKMQAALGAGLRPILCVGEQLGEREEGRAEQAVEKQLLGCLQGVDSPGALVVAYEPIWAIGTGRAATAEVAQSMMDHIRTVLGSLYGQDESAKIPLLYGGSVSPSNISELMRKRDINGALVGGASLNADSFIEIVRKAAEVQA